MKLIAKAKDYYDFALHLTAEQNEFWQRDKEEETFWHKDTRRSIDIRYPPEKYRAAEVCLETIWFAGKSYPFVSVRIWKESYPEPEYFWKLDQLLEFLKEKGIQIPHWQLRELKAVKLGEPSLQDEQALAHQRISVASTVSYCKAIWRPGLEMLVPSHKRHRQIYTNHSYLGLLGFQQILDPYTAAQELCMWWSHFDQAEPPQVTDNKVKIQKAGFDPVTSFRNPIK